MARDTELDRLKTAQDLAYTRKQDAWKAQGTAYKARDAAKTVMNNAFSAKQSAYNAQDTAWQALQAVRNRKGPAIDQAKRDQESAYQNMGRAFDDASAAHGRHDGAGARSYADRGKAYKAESQWHVARRRELITEINVYRDRHEATKPAFQAAKARFLSAKADFERLKAIHETARDKFQEAKKTHETAKAAFTKRLEVVKAANQRRSEDNKTLAAKAGVPVQYRDSVYVTTKPDGTVNIYFGGIDKPNGPGHGHYAMDRNGKITYKRNPFDPHGAQNFTDSQRDYQTVITSEASRSGEFGFRCKFRGYDAYVESNTNQQGRAKIDIYYGSNGPFGPGHHHAVAYRDTPNVFVADNIR